MVITTPPIPRHVAILYSWMECNNLFQVINEPTHITPIGATLLDLVITNYPVIYDFAIDRFNAIIHTRLRLYACALNYYLFKIGCRERPACFCGFQTETVKHFFLECPLYSAPRITLLSSAARILFADRWSSMSKSQIISVFLFGSPLLSLEQNNDFLEIPKYARSTCWHSFFLLSFPACHYSM